MGANQISPLRFSFSFLREAQVSVYGCTLTVHYTAIHQQSFKAVLQFPLVLTKFAKNSEKRLVQTPKLRGSETKKIRDTNFVETCTLRLVTLQAELWGEGALRASD